jgi:hypothetical protein
MGFVLTFLSLFAKIQRVKLVYEAGLRMQRKAIRISSVAHIMAFMILGELAILVPWQILSPLRWQRDVLSWENSFPVSSVGTCTSETGSYFIIVMVSFHIVCLFYALVLCYKTQNLNSDFAESSHISLAVAFMFQVMVLVVPISALVKNTTNAFYFIRVCAVFFQNVTVLSLIFIPKMLRLHFEERYNTDNDQKGRFRGRQSAFSCKCCMLKSIDFVFRLDKFLISLVIISFFCHQFSVLHCGF